MGDPSVTTIINTAVTDTDEEGTSTTTNTYALVVLPVTDSEEEEDMESTSSGALPANDDCEPHMWAVDGKGSGKSVL